MMYVKFPPWEEQIRIIFEYGEEPFYNEGSLKGMDKWLVYMYEGKTFITATFSGKHCRFFETLLKVHT